MFINYRNKHIIIGYDNKNRKHLFEINVNRANCMNDCKRNNLNRNKNKIIKKH